MDWAARKSDKNISRTMKMAVLSDYLYAILMRNHHWFTVCSNENVHYIFRTVLVIIMRWDLC